MLVATIPGVVSQTAIFGRAKGASRTAILALPCIVVADPVVGKIFAALDTNAHFATQLCLFCSDSQQVVAKVARVTLKRLY